MATSADKSLNAIIRISPKFVCTKHRAFNERSESGGKAVADKRHMARIVALDLGFSRL
jgi:hypothetical protein